MLNLSVNGIKDFQICERLFDYRHLEKLPEKIYSRDIHTEKFENTIKNIIYFFMFKKQSGTVPSYSAILNRWEKMWFPKDTTSYDIITEQHETVYGNTASLTSKAAASLLLFYEKYSNLNIIPIAISEEYYISTKKQSNIKDSFDLIFYKDRTFFVTKILFNYKQSQKDSYKIDFACLKKGFENKHPDKVNRVKYGYIDVLSQNVGFTEYILTEDDIIIFDEWCDKIDSTEIFMSKRGLIPHCKKCPFNDPCSKWKKDK
jgi:hypothetical protein